MTLCKLPSGCSQCLTSGRKERVLKGDGQKGYKKYNLCPFLSFSFCTYSLFVFSSRFYNVNIFIVSFSMCLTHSSLSLIHTHLPTGITAQIQTHPRSLCVTREFNWSHNAYRSHTLSFFPAEMFQVI